MDTEDTKLATLAAINELVDTDDLTGPRDWDQEKKKAIIRKIWTLQFLKGFSRKRACELLGVSPNTCKYWVSTGVWDEALEEAGFSTIRRVVDDAFIQAADTVVGEFPSLFAILVRMGTMQMPGVKPKVALEALQTLISFVENFQARVPLPPREDPKANQSEFEHLARFEPARRRYKIRPTSEGLEIEIEEDPQVVNTEVYSSE